MQPELLEWLARPGGLGEQLRVYRSMVDHLSGLAVHGADAVDLLKP